MSDNQDVEKGWARLQPTHGETSQDYVLPDTDLLAGREIDPDSVRPVKSLDEDGIEVDDPDDMETDVIGE